MTFYSKFATECDFHLIAQQIHCTIKTLYNKYIAKDKAVESMSASLKNITGRPIRVASDFYGREREVAHIWRKLETDHILLLAPRRVGKTSLMFYLCHEAQSREQPRVVYLSVAGVETELAFVQAIYKAVVASPGGSSLFARFVQRLQSSAVARWFQRIESVGVPDVFEVALREVPPEEWMTVGQTLLSTLRGLGGQWLILMDEVPIFVLALLRQDPTARRARTFLNWFRDVRQGPPQGENLRWLLAGSIGLDVLARRYNLSDTINDLSLESLDAFSVDVADRFLHDLGTSYQLPLQPAVRQRIIERAGWPIPFYLQLFFSNILEVCNDERAVPSVATVETVFEHLLSPAKRTYFDYWNQRLHEELGAPHSEWARALLKACALDATGASRTTLEQTLTPHLANPTDRDDTLHWLLDVLLSDGYLTQQQVNGRSRYRFRANLLREFWLRRFVQ